MRLQPGPDALAFAASVRELLATSCDDAALRAAWDSADGRVPGLGKRLAEVGVTGLTVPERHGGAGADITAAVPVLVECGRAAAPEPVVATLVGVDLLARSGGPVAAEWLPRVAAGEATVAVGEGDPATVVGGRWAQLFLLAGPAGVRAVPRESASVEAAPSLDVGAGLAMVSAPAGAGTLVEGADGVAAFDTACVLVAAELLGLAQAMLEMSVRHARRREQFGRPVGSFQAVKHRLADVHVATSFALPVLHRAAWSVARAAPSRGRDASHAKHAATVAAERAARAALQVHAAIGYTYEHVLHMWLKRTWTWASMWGTAEEHRRRVTAAVLPEPVG